MKRQMIFTLALMWLAARPQAVLAAGFAINEIDAQGLGMGNALTAVADRPSAVVFNPAGLAQQQGLGLNASVSLIAPEFGYDTALPTTGAPIRVDAKRDAYVIPSVYAGYRLHDRVALGLGLYVPFGLATRWNDTVGDGIPWWGRSSSRDLDLKTVFINGAVAVKLHDRLYFGAGLVVAQAAVTLGRAITLSRDVAEDVDVELSGEDVGFGATAGLLLQVVPKRLNVGIAYRSAVKFDFAGNAAFTRGGSADAIPSSLRQQLVDGKVTAPVTVPHLISFGAAAFPLPQLTVSANVDITTWSTFDALRINFVDNPELSTVARRDWNNTFAFRLGAEYLVLPDNLPLRLGFVFDQSPVPDSTVGPDLPDADRFIIALGVGYTWRGIRADLGYQFLVTPKQETDDNVAIVGTRDAQAHIASFGLGYNLDI